MSAVGGSPDARFHTTDRLSFRTWKPDHHQSGRDTKRARIQAAAGQGFATTDDRWGIL
jgi:hypothetical protein